MSDHMWLWARGFEGGGPQAELLRRISHWLMKEPALEEEDLRAEVRDGQLTITRRSLSLDLPEVTVTPPSGEARPLKLSADAPRRGPATLTAEADGLYRHTAVLHTTPPAPRPLNPFTLPAPPPPPPPT